MIKPYDTFMLLSEQDYGPWLDKISLYKINDKVFLQESFGYGKPYDNNWYCLSTEPTTSLAEAFRQFSGLICGSDDTTDYEMQLGVKLTKVPNPWQS